MKENIKIIAEMQYNNGPDLARRESEVIVEGSIGENWQFKIINTHGMHPCAYVRIPENTCLASICRELSEKSDRPFYDSSIFNHIHCHGGLTFGEVFDGTSPNPLWGEGIWLGWDYGHCGDWAGYETEEENLVAGNHKWSIHDIIPQVADVIHLLADEVDRTRLIRYVARDSDGILHVFTDKPEKGTLYWDSSDAHLTVLGDESFKDVKWEDDEPTLIIATLDKVSLW